MPIILIDWNLPYNFENKVSYINIMKETALGTDNVEKLTRAELEEIVKDIIKVMYYDENGNVPEDDKPWDSDTPDNVHGILWNYSLVPMTPKQVICGIITIYPHSEWRFPLKKKRNLFEEAYQRFLQGGSQAILDFAKEENIEDWRYCPACDKERPCVEDTCLVCDQPLGW